MVKSTGISLASSSDAAGGIWSRVDGWLERAGERLNPILVKEARQALKSRQFVLTFSLLLICGWGWSMIGVALQPAISYQPSGQLLLVGYFIVLVVAVLLIVPFAAYRSLAAEREDGTFELLSVTTLNARQIVTGKLGSAVLQTIVLFSALSPCIAFTYLLRGVDLVTMSMLLAWAFLASVLFSAIGLAVAAATPHRPTQLLLSVGLVLGLFFATIAGCSYGAAIVWENAPAAYDDADFWIVQAALLTACISYLVLLILGAAAQLSFASDNRSTRLRVVMLVQQLLFLGWMTWFWLDQGDRDIPYVAMSCSALHWWLMGSLLSGELVPLSPRVQRSLPQSFLGRLLLTWFNPGSGTGYVFAVINLAVAVVLIQAFVPIRLLSPRLGGAAGANLDIAELASFGLLLVAYVAAYLGAGRLITLWLRRYLVLGPLLLLLVNAVLAALGAAGPYFLQGWWLGTDGFRTYSFLQAPNWLWTLNAVGKPNFGANLLAPLAAVAAGFAAFTANLLLVAPEVDKVRVAPPPRILEDEREQHPERFAPPPAPKSPFED